MKVLNGDLLITKATLEEILKHYSAKFEEEVRSGIYRNDLDCASYDKIQGLVDSLVALDDYRSEQLI